MEASERLLPPAHPVAESWWNDSFMVTFAFKCNIACTFCMVEDALNVFEGTSLAAFRRFAEDPTALRGASRIIFSGGEVTLARDLLDYVAVARTLPGVKHVRLQTNAIRLADRAYLRTLVEAGVDELFVSLHAPDAATYDAVAQKKGSFGRIIEGLSAIRDLGVTLITNTAIVEANYRLLPAIVELGSSFGPRSMEFWSYWPRADEDGGRLHAARVSDVRGPLLEALRRAIAKGIPPVVKWFPRCLLGDLAWCQDDGQPPALIEDRYWEREPEYGCLYAGVCSEAMSPSHGERGAGKCAGLSDAYVHRFGWEENVLKPARGARVATENDGSRRNPRVARSLLKDAAPRRAEQARATAKLASLGILRGQELAGLTLAGVEPSRDGTALTLAFRDGDLTVQVALCDPDPSRPCSARSVSFDLFYRPISEVIDRRAAALVEALAARMASAPATP